MAISSVLSTATGGLFAAGRQADAAASNIANVNSEPARHVRASTSSVVAAASSNNPAGGSGVATQLIVSNGAPDLATSTVDLMRAEAAFKASASVVHTAEQLSKDTLNLFA